MVRNILYMLIWDVNRREKLFLTKGGYYMVVSGFDANNVVWEVIEDNFSGIQRRIIRLDYEGLILIYFTNTRGDRGDTRIYWF